MNRADLASRKVEVMEAAAERWKETAPDRARTAERLARGGSTAATSAERAAAFMARENARRRRGVDELAVERIIGDTDDLDEMPPNPTARKAGAPIARIVELVGSNTIGDGFATGFLLAPRLLMTNWHVFADAADAQGCGAQFGYERAESGVLESGTAFELDPGAFFLSDRALDIAIIGLKPKAAVGTAVLSAYGRVRLIPTMGKILVGHAVSIIQHPDGRQKHWAVRQNKLVLEPKDGDIFLNYTTDTLPGSSGSPAFNRHWEMVAVHHSGVPRKESGEIRTKTGGVWKKGMPDSDIDWVANEGARVSKIHAYLGAAKLSNAQHRAVLAALLSASGDPVLTADEALVTAPVKAPDTGGTVMNIVVNGTANFYMDGRGAGSAAVPPPSDAGAIEVPVVGIEKKLRFDPDYDNRPGFDSTFFQGFDIPPLEAPSGEVLKEGGQAHVLHYHHYSLVMHKKRRLAMWAMANVDYSEGKRWRSRDELGDDTWKGDPRILMRDQIEDLELYAPAAKFDRGHIVRRDDVAWGDTKESEEFGNSDSFHWTNCTPQHEGFNRDAFGYHGLWGQLENHIAKQAGFVQNRLCVLSGPVLDPGDPERDFGSGIDVKVPIVFWKVVVAVEQTGGNGTLRAYGFLLDQTDAIQRYGWEGRFRVGKFKEQQVSLADLTQRSRVKFPQVLLDADPLGNVPEEGRKRSLQSLDDLTLR